MNVSDTEREIARILAEFERSNDCIVDSVSLTDIDITSVDDNRRQLIRHVTIETHRIPGSNWG